MNIDWATILDLVIAGVLGGAVGGGELVSRYRDEPWDTLRRWPALFYMGLNAVAAVVALVLIRGFGWTFGVTGVDTVRLIQLLVAGFGAMALFRTSLFTIRVGEQDIAVGPSSFLQVALLAADREVDRKRATLRSERTCKAMEGVSFKKALEALPVYCIALMQNLPQEDQNQLSSDLAKLAKSTNINDRIKSLILGLALINHVGDDVLEAAVSSLGNEIKEEPTPTPKSAS